MAKIIVSVMLEGSDKLRDYEVPSDISSEELVERLVKEFGSHINLGNDEYGFQLMVAGSGRPLDRRETLEEAGVWDGALLIIHPYRMVRAEREAVAKTEESPVSGWRALDTLYAKEKEKESKFKATTRFVWKKLD